MAWYEILVLSVGIWLVASVALALMFGRVIRANDDEHLGGAKTGLLEIGRRRTSP
jgi:hypothetical protein